MLLSDPCSRTVSMPTIKMGILVKEIEEHTVLGAVGAQLALCNPAKYHGPMFQQAVDDPVLAALLEVLEAALQKITRVRVRIRKREMDEGFCKHGLLALEGYIYAEQRRIGISLNETRAIGRSAAW
jgi:hypothetical protein